MKRGLAIICVDDERIVLDSLKAQLNVQFNNEALIEIAESGEEALDLIDELKSEGFEAALVISDQIMPSMKGDELLIKIHEAEPSMLKILLTGQADAEAVGNAVNKAGLYRYIAKPWEETDLILTAREAIQSFKKEKTLEVQNAKLKDLNSNLEIKVEDRTKKIMKQHGEIVEKNNELKQTIDELTRTKISKKAAWITLIIVVVLFILSEIIIEPIIENYFQRTWWLALVFKLLIALSLKPIDSLAERFLFMRIDKGRGFNKINAARLINTSKTNDGT